MKHLTIGSHIKMLRIERGMTQDDMVKNFEQVTGHKISASGLSHYETDKRKPDPSLIGALADYFGVSADYIMGRTDDRKATVPADSGLHNENVKYKQYSEIFDQLHRRLIEEGILKEGQNMTPDQLRLFLALGEDTAVRILKSKGIDPAVLLK